MRQHHQAQNQQPQNELQEGHKAALLVFCVAAILIIAHNIYAIIIYVIASMFSYLYIHFFYFPFAMVFFTLVKSILTWKIYYPLEVLVRQSEFRSDRLQQLWQYLREIDHQAQQAHPEEPLDLDIFADVNDFIMILNVAVFTNRYVTMALVPTFSILLLTTT